MKAYVLTFFVALVLGIAGGVALGVFVYPYLFLTDIVANEKVPPQQPAPEAQRKVLARGNFVHANPNDPIHYGKGAGERLSGDGVPRRGLRGPRS